MKKPTKMVKIKESTAKGLRQYANEFQSMVDCDDFDFNDAGVVADIEKLCRFILRNVKVDKR